MVAVVWCGVGGGTVVVLMVLAAVDICGLLQEGGSSTSRAAVVLDS